MCGDPLEITERYVSYMMYGSESSSEDKEEHGKDVNLGKAKKIPSKDFHLIDVSKCENFGGNAFVKGILFLNEINEPVLGFKRGGRITPIYEFSTIGLFSVAIGALFKDRPNNAYMYKCPIDFIPKDTKVEVYMNLRVPKIYSKEYATIVALSTKVCK